MGPGQGEELREVLQLVRLVTQMSDNYKAQIGYKECDTIYQTKMLHWHSRFCDLGGVKKVSKQFQHTFHIQYEDSFEGSRNSLAQVFIFFFLTVWSSKSFSDKTWSVVHLAGSRQPWNSNPRNPNSKTRTMLT